MIRLWIAKLKGVVAVAAIGRYLKGLANLFGKFLSEPRNSWALLILCVVGAFVNLYVMSATATVVRETATAIISTVTATITGTSTSTPTNTGTPTTAPTITSTPPWDIMVDSYFATMPYPFMRDPDDWDVSDDGVRFVSFWEGYVGSPYDDGGQPGVGNCTIGYGHLLHLGPCTGGESPASISQAAALDLLEDELNHCGDYVPKYVNVPVSQNQFNILAGLVCGVGYDRFSRYEFVAILNEGRYYAASQKLKETGVYGIGIGLCPGLVRRRAVEAEKFIAFSGNPMWPFVEHK